MPNPPSFDPPPEKGLRRVEMHFRSRSGSGKGEPYLHRLSVEGNFGGIVKHSFDSEKILHWKNIDEKLTVGLIGTLLVFIRTQRRLALQPGFAIQPSMAVDSCDSRVAPFALTVYGVFHKGKNGYDTWCSEIIGVETAANSGPAKPLLRFNYKFSDVRRNNERYRLLKLVQPFDIATTLDGHPLSTDEELEVIDAALLARFNAKDSRSGGSSCNGDSAPAPASQLSSISHGPSVSEGEPIRLQTFFRQSELQRALVKLTGTAPLFIQGPEQIGKTILAQKLAQHWRETGAEGREPPVVWIDAERQATPVTLELIFAYLIQKLPFPALHGKPLNLQAEELRKQLAAQRGLLVIESYEHVHDPAKVAAYLTSLRAPARVIVTGARVPRGLERQFICLQLHEMTPDEARNFFDSLADDFDLEPHLRAAREQVISKVGGHPGAMLKAIRCLKDYVPIEEILHDDFFVELFERTWKRCHSDHPDQCTVLLALACFPFGAKREALAAVTGLEPAALQQALASLRGLVESFATSGEPRFAVTPSLAASVRARAQQDLKVREEALKQRQVEYYDSFASKIGRCWNELEKMEPLDHIEEQQTITHVIDYCRSKKMWAEMARIARGCRYHAYTRGQWVGAGSLIEIWNEAVRQLNEPEQEFEARTYLLNIQSKQQDRTAAEQSIKSLEKLRKKKRNLPEGLIVQYLHARALHNLACGDLGEAEKLWNGAIARNKAQARKRDEHDQSAMVRWRGVCLFKQGRLDEALAAFKEHLEHAEKHSFARPALVAQLHLEEIRFLEGEPAEAARRLVDLAPKIAALHDLRLHADHQWLLARCLAKTGPGAAARTALENAIDAYRRLGSQQLFTEASGLLEEINRAEDGIAHIQ